MENNRLSRPLCGRCRLSSQCIPLNDIKELTQEYVICRFCGTIFHMLGRLRVSSTLDVKKVASLHSVCGAFVAEAMTHGNWIGCEQAPCKRSRDEVGENAYHGDMGLSLGLTQHLDLSEVLRAALDKE